jgi:hypothetical protein
MALARLLSVDNLPRSSVQIRHPRTPHLASWIMLPLKGS